MLRSGIKGVNLGCPREVKDVRPSDDALANIKVTNAASGVKRFLTG